MKIKTLTLGMMQNNIYIVSEGGKCFLVDPGWDIKAIEQALKSDNLTCKFIILTHGHFDHSKNLYKLIENLDVPIYIHEFDADMLEKIPAEKIKTLTGGDTIKFGESEMKIIHTPGHTQGGICILINGNLFTGDTLFVGQCGRVDLPHSNPEKMYESLIKLSKLAPDIKVYPGHTAGISTIAREVKTNPYILLALKSKEDFLSAIK
jgi:glyoxylase-like metal-dependent hydrolase (beta-lactamase superfamily II)